MDETLSLATNLRRWQGDRGTYHHVIIQGETAEAITMHERIRRLEFGSRRGFGSVKVMAQIGEHALEDVGVSIDRFLALKQQGCSAAKSWWLLISKKVMRSGGPCPR